MKFIHQSSQFIILVGIIYVLFKIFSPELKKIFYRYVLGMSPKEEEDMDFDRLVRRKIDQLTRGQNESLSRNVVSSTPLSSKKDNTKDKILSEFERIKAKYNENPKEYEKDYQNVKELMSLIDSFEWGEGKHFDFFYRNLQTKLPFQWDLDTIKESAKYIYKQDIITELRRNELPNLVEISKVIEVHIFLKMFLNPNDLTSEQFFINLSDKFKVSRVELILGLFIWLNPSQEITTLDLDEIKNDLARYLKTSINNHLLQQNRSEFTDLKNVLAALKDSIKIAQAISPIPALTKKSTDTELISIFNLKSLPNKKELKSLYKKFAALKHPDNLDRLKLSESLKSLANENFNNLKTAYEILLERVE